MRIVSFLMAAVVLIIGAGAAVAQQSITLEEVSPVWYFQGEPVLPVGQDVTFKIRITNINGMGYCYNPQFLFTVSSTDGATWGSTEITYSSMLANQFSQIFSYSSPNMLPYHPTTGSDVDSVGLVCIAFAPPALYDGFDGVVVSITVRPDPSAAGTHLSLDAITNGSEPFGWEWVFASFSASPNILPEWDGPHYFEISPLPCGPPEFSDSNPAEVRGPYCESLTASFEAGWAEDSSCASEVTYSIVDGPGTIDPSTGVWVWDDAFELGLVGQAVPVIIKASSGENYSQETLMATATYGAPEFTSGCSTAIQVEKGNVADMLFSAEAPCPEAPIDFFIADDGGSGGYYYFVDGRLRWDTYFASIGNYTWVVGATTGPDTVFCTVSVDVVNSGCCGLYTNGFTGNTDCSPDGKVALVDITRLVDRVYLSKGLLCCEWNGNVDGDVMGKMDLADITRLIDHVYLSKEATASCQ